jgi:hypothetical protein
MNTLRNYGASFRTPLFCNNPVTRVNRFNRWLEKTYKTAVTLSVAAQNAFGSTTARQWIRGETEPGAANIAVLHELGLGVHWYFTGEGSMFSETEKGRAFARNHPDGDTGQTASGAATADRTPELIRRIRGVLDEFE